MRSILVVLLALVLVPAGANAADCAAKTIYLVRHAEKATSADDPDVVLSAAGAQRALALATTLQGKAIDAIYATHLRRTQQTAAPLAVERDLTVQVLPADATGRLIERLKHAHCKRAVLVAGHSNTVPEILQALGIAQPPAIAETDFGQLFVVRRVAGKAKLEIAHF